MSPGPLYLYLRGLLLREWERGGKGKRKDAEKGKEKKKEGKRREEGRGPGKEKCET